MDLTTLDNNRLVKIDYIFLLRRLIEAEDDKDIVLQNKIKSLLADGQEYAEEHKCLPYGPTIEVGFAKIMFSTHIHSCPAII